jgi:signal transduction histidine kinase
VLNNLIANALDHVSAGGTLWLEIEPLAGPWIEVAISDDGSGIAKEDLPHIFEPFYRSGKAGDASGHAGLGLAIARRMVELQGGEIKADNRPTGGACFRFTLPLASL